MNSQGVIILVETSSKCPCSNNGSSCITVHSGTMSSSDDVMYGGRKQEENINAGTLYTATTKSQLRASYRRQ